MAGDPGPPLRATSRFAPRGRSPSRQETETVGISSRSSDEASACEGRRPLTSLRRRDDGMMHHSRFGSLTELIERPTMGSMMRDALCTHRRVILRVLSRLLEQGPRAWLLPHVFTDTLHAVCKEMGSLDLPESQFGATYCSVVHEIVVVDHTVAMALRPRVGTWEFVCIDVERAEARDVDVQEYLQAKEALVDTPRDPFTLEVDMQPFNRDFPRMHRTSWIGQGVNYLNRYLSSRLFRETSPRCRWASGSGFTLLYKFMEGLRYGREQLLVHGEVIANEERFQLALEMAEGLLKKLDPATPSREVLEDYGLRDLGFAPGWGDTAGSIMTTVHMALDLSQAPDDRTLSSFLARLPMVFRVVILSPHGFFGQEGVLGRPDTGGQVVYILDQCRALEKEMGERIRGAGLDVKPEILVVTRLIPDAQGTTCDQRIEPIRGCQHARILRVPFRTGPRVLHQWVSRFRLWPYLEQFALDCAHEIQQEFGTNPDFVIGNNSDGNLVASLLATRLDAVQCSIAHALEKCKYPNADIYWQGLDREYHFSCQFTADLISMNTSDFIISSTYQEIAGTETSVGQYEAHQHWTMPGLYRVVKGIDVFDPKFNIVSPGVDPDLYFPYKEEDRRLRELQPDLEALVFGRNEDDVAQGYLDDTEKPILFSMARLDSVKNLTGLVEWFGKNARLRELCNLVIVGGNVQTRLCKDREELAQCELMHALMDELGLRGSVRWVQAQTEPRKNGELYRMIADKRGAFVQPARYEAFGLTVVEAMTCGLPAFVTNRGGPAEIVQHGQSGFHIDPYHGDAAAEVMADFFDKCREDPDEWLRVSEGALDRIAKHYTWDNYAERLLTLQNIYAFWRHSTHMERKDTRRYLEMLYLLVMRPLVAKVPLADEDGDAERREPVGPDILADGPCKAAGGDVARPQLAPGDTSHGALSL